ncbi:MAG: radical SAM protein [Geobacteraceae bacterium]
MELTVALSRIKNELFYGSSNYTKNQPDLFVPHHFKMLAPSQVGPFVEMIKESVKEEEILLYFHLPFCFSECLFCNSFPLKVDKHIQQDYLQHLLKEITLFSECGFFDGKKVKCIYFGGGTPTSFSNRDLKLIIDKIRSSIDFAENCNITSEAHPLTLSSEERIAGLAKIGISRISIGCQTFDPDILFHCNRTNTPAQVQQIVTHAQKHGMAINIDMMSGLPGQTIASVRKDLELLEEIRPNAIEYIRHEIVNPLVVELYKTRPDLIVEDDTLFEMVYITQEWMESLGYEQNGRFSNDKQWGYRYHWLKEMPIIAFGSRTRSYTKSICYDKHEDLSTYTRMISKGILPIGRYIPLSKRERMYRSLILGLQLKCGLDIKHFHDTYCEDAFEVFGPVIAKLNEYGCLQQDADSISLTKYGAYFVEDVCDFIIDAALKDESGDLVRASHSGGSRYLSVA